MAADTIIIKYKADTADFSKSLNNVTTDLTKAGIAGDKAGDKTAASFNKAATAINKTDAQTKKTTGAFNGMASSLTSIAGSLGVAFGVQQIIQFGKASAEAFIDAEKNAQLLLFALKGNEAAQGRLMAQATELQNTTIFDDDTIQQAQTFLANQGRTEEQIKKVINAAVELSTVTGVDLNTAVMQLDGTFEGQIGKMGKLDSGFKSLTKEQLANGAAADLLIEKYGGTAKAMGETTAGQAAKLKNQFGELQETIGGKLVPVISNMTEGLVKIFDGNATGGIVNYLDHMELIFPMIQEVREALQSFKDGKILEGIGNSFEVAASTITAGFYTRIKNAATGMDEVVDSLTDYEKAIIAVSNATDDEITAKFEALGGATNATAMEFKKFTDELRSGILLQTLTDLQQVLDIDAKKFKELTDQTDKYGISVRVTADAILGLKNATTDDLVTTFKKAKEVIHDLTWEGFKEYVLTIKKIPTVTDDITKKTDKLVGPFDSLNNRISELNKQMLDAITLGKDYTKIEMELGDAIKRRDEITREAAIAQMAMNPIIKENNDLIELSTEVNETNYEAIKKVNDEKLRGIIDSMNLKKEEHKKELNWAEELQQVNQAGTQLFSALKEKELADVGDNEEKKKAIMKKYAIPEFILKTSEIIANTAVAVMQALAQLGPVAGGIASGFIIATGAVQEGIAADALARVLALNEGTEFVSLNGNKKGIDTIPAMLNEGEAVIPTEKNLKEPGLAKAWINGNLDKYVIDKWVSPALVAQEQAQKREFADNIASSLMLQSGANFDDYRLYRLGIDQLSLQKETNMILGKLTKNQNPWAV